jgi:hypothetical protein
MAFGMGFGELFLILIIVAAVFGSTKLPGAGDLFGRWLRGSDPSRPRLLAPRSDRWTTVDWLLLATTLALAAALALSFARE